MENVIGHVPRVRIDGPRGGVGEDDGGPGDGDGVPHGVGGDVGEVDEHAQAVHLPHDLPAEGGEAAAAGQDGRLGLGGIGPGK